MIPNFKTYLKESVWSDIRKKSLGTDKRKEDEINHMNGDDFYDYLNRLYVGSGRDTISGPFTDDTIVIPMISNNTYFNLEIEYEPGRTKIDFITVPDLCLMMYDDLSEVFGVMGYADDESRIAICPKEYGDLTNTFVIDVIDYFLDNSSDPRKNTFKKVVDESVWSDIRKKSLGKEERIEDNIDGLGFHEFVSYLKDTYTIDDPTNFFDIGIFPTMGTDIVNISIPIEKKDIYGEDRNGNRMLTIGKDQKTDEFVNIRPNKYIFYLYPREMTSSRLTITILN